jgi:WD40 repeat protein
MTTPIYKAIFTVDGTQVVLGGHNGSVQLWETKTGHHITNLQETGSSIMSIAQSLNGNYLLAGDDGGVVSLWDKQTNHLEKTFSYRNTPINLLSFSQDGKSLVISCGDKLTVVDTTSWEETTSFSGHYPPLAGAITPSGEHVVIGSGDGAFYLVDIQTRKLLYEYISKDGEQTLHITFGPHSQNAYIWDTYNVWEWHLGNNQMRSIVSSQSSLGEILPGDISRDERFVAISEFGTYKPRIIDLETLEILQVFEGHSDIVYSIMFSPDTEFVVTASHDGTARIWNTKTGKQTHMLF